MAVRAILRRKSFISEYIHSSSSYRPIQILCNHDNAFQNSEPQINGIAIKKHHSLVEFSTALGQCSRRRGYYASMANGRPQRIAPLGMRWMCTSARNVSTAAAATNQREVGSVDDDDHDDEENEEFISKKRKEASPEECDQALQSLTNVKAKAKAKRLQEQKVVANSVLPRLWTTFQGIGPALKAVVSMSKADWAKKLVHWKKGFVSTVQHYWFGCKLLWTDIKISSRLLLKLLHGNNLSRRERKQLVQTTVDIFKLVPLAVFIIVPSGEFVLLLVLKYFPNILPSTFQDKMKDKEAMKRRLNAMIEYAKFLQETAIEMAKEVQRSRGGEIENSAKDLHEFLNRLRRGAFVSNEDILGFAKLCNDELTLDMMSRARLVSMCKYMDISPYGPNAYLRYMLRKRLRRIKEDDKLIQEEGVESLSEDELRKECRTRGMLGLHSADIMRQELRDWLELSLNHSVSSSLLILSRAFTVSRILRPEEIIQATLSSLPDEIVGTEEEREEEEQATMKAFNDSQEDVALKEMTVPIARDAQEQATTRTWEKQEQLCELSRALAILASSSSVSREREEFLRLVNKEIEIYNKMVENEGIDGEKYGMRANIASREERENDNEVAEVDEVSSTLIERVDAMIQNLEKEIDEVDAKIGDSWQLLDRDLDGKVTPEEVAGATMYLKNTLSENEGVTIQDLISSLSKDREGKILVEDIIKLGRWNEDAN